MRYVPKAKTVIHSLSYNNPVLTMNQLVGQQMQQLWRKQLFHGITHYFQLQSEYISNLATHLSDVNAWTNHLSLDVGKMKMQARQVLNQRELERELASCTVGDEVSTPEVTAMKTDDIFNAAGVLSPVSRGEASVNEEERAIRAPVLSASKSAPLTTTRKPQQYLNASLYHG